MAALWLRLRESRRRAGLPLLAAGMTVVALVSLVGGDTVDGRYGLATDLAAVLAYVSAVFYGAFPIAVDRERKRAYLPSASPVTPWQWALGNALGAAVVAGLGAFALFTAAGVGTALAGGIETHAVTPIGGRGLHFLQPDLAITNVPDDAREVRLELRSFLTVPDTVGTADAASISVNGEPYEVYSNQTRVFPIRGPRIQLKKLSDDFEVGIVADRVRVIGAERSFLWNALRAAVGPTLGAATLAVLGAIAGANLGAAVAALLTSLLLLLSGMKGFLLDTFEYQGASQQKVEATHGHDHHHHHGPRDFGAARGAAEAIVTGALFALPDVAELDRTRLVAVGDWIDDWQLVRGLKILAVALAAATVLGGVGVHLRRLP